MPASRNFRRVSRLWQRRASALRSSIGRLIRPAFSSTAVRPPRVSPHDRTKALNAPLTWQHVSSGFFPPPPLTHPRTKQMGQRHQALVTDQTRIRAPLEVVEAQLRLLVFKAAL